MTMSTFVSRLSEAPGRLVWVDYTAYAGGLLAGGSVPWLDVTALIAWQRKAQSLLKSDVLALPVDAVAAAWLATHPELVAAMAAKRRAVFPLKTLLVDEALRAHFVELAKGLRGSFGGATLALAIPSPRHWIGLAYAQALSGEEVAVGEDEADSAAVYIADFLRAFGDSGIDVLLLKESLQTEPAEVGAFGCYQSTLNVAAHYRWDTGLYLPAGRCSGGDAGVGFVAAPAVPAGTAAAGVIVPAEFWAGAAAPAAGKGVFYLAEVPAAANPETVLERLAVLRGS
jgi:hypothetical protein